jgi:hypothetical protein
VNARMKHSEFKCCTLSRSLPWNDRSSVWLPKPGGGQRGLGIPNVVDRVGTQGSAGFYFANCQRCMEIFDQTFLVEGLAQHANRTCLQSPRAGSFFGRGRNEDDRGVKSLGEQLALQLNPAQTWHLHIGDHTLRVIDLVRLQKIFGRCKSGGAVWRGRGRR